MSALASLRSTVRSLFRREAQPSSAWSCSSREQLRKARGAARPILPWLLSVTMLSWSCGSDVRAEIGDTAIRSVPQDAAWFFSSQLLKRQWDGWLKSRAYQRFEAGVAFQGAMMQVRSVWNNPPDPSFQEFKNWYEQPENQQLQAFLLDAVSQEVFAYGNAGHGEWLQELMKLSQLVNQLQLEALQSGEEPDEAAIQRLFLDKLNELQGRITVPATLIGFRITDSAAGLAQLDRLEKTLRQLIDENAEAAILKERLARQQVGGVSVLTLTLKGSDIPWEQIQAEVAESTENSGQINDSLEESPAATPESSSDESTETADDESSDDDSEASAEEESGEEDSAEDDDSADADSEGAETSEEQANDEEQAAEAESAEALTEDESAEGESAEDESADDAAEAAEESSEEAGGAVEVAGAEIDPAEFIARLRQALEPLDLVIAIGISDQYAFISIGGDLTPISQFGTGPSLYDHEKMAPLRAQSQADFTSIAYLSDSLMTSLGAQRSQIESNFALMQAGLEQAVQQEEFPADLMDDIRHDLGQVRDRIVEWLPVPGAFLQFQTIKASGPDVHYDAYSYNWSQDPFSDSTQPLTLLQHVGPDPLAFSVARIRVDMESYRLLRRVAQRLTNYADRLVGAQGEDESQNYQMVKEAFLPYVQQADQILETKLLPGLGDGQFGIALDGYTSRQQWHESLPKSDEPLVMPHLTWLQGVQDAALVEEGLKELYRVAQAAYGKARELAGEGAEADFPWDQLPTPTVEYVSAGKLFSYTLPAETGIDPQTVRPHGALAPGVLLVGYLPQSTQKLLAAEPDSELLNSSRMTGPLSSASYWNFAGTIAIVSDWADYGYSVMLSMQEPDQAQAFGFQMAKNQVDIILDILQCLRTVTSITYAEGEATVTHSHWLIRDLE